MSLIDLITGMTNCLATILRRGQRIRGIPNPAASAATPRGAWRKAVAQGEVCARHGSSSNVAAGMR